MPQVSWWRDSHLIDSSFEKTFGRTVQNTLSVPQVSREDLGAMLTCQASNNNISAPASSRVTIDLKCKYNYYKLIIIIIYNLGPLKDFESSGAHTGKFDKNFAS